MQRRLVALGFDVAPDDLGQYSAGTAAAVVAFQERRGLRADGVCGDHTWSALVEAGYRLGDRPLYLTHPMLRGDDVSVLQSQLGALGFDAGRVDGIFGERTDRALADFQRNAGLVTDSICGPATVTALARLGLSCVAPHSSASLRERERMRAGPSSLRGRLIAVGDTGGFGALAGAVAAAIGAAGGRAVLLQDADGSELARKANTSDADAYVGLSFAEPEPGDKVGREVTCATAYYQSPSGWQSLEGRRLALVVHERLRHQLDAADGGVRGMAVPVLRETKMPAVVADLAPADVLFSRAAEVAATVTGALDTWLIESAG